MYSQSLLLAWHFLSENVGRLGHARDQSFVQRSTSVRVTRSRLLLTAPLPCKFPTLPLRVLMRGRANQESSPRAAHAPCSSRSRTSTILTASSSHASETQVPSTPAKRLLLSGPFNDHTDLSEGTWLLQVKAQVAIIAEPSLLPIFSPAYTA